jgi:hypothetical protein
MGGNISIPCIPSSQLTSSSIQIRRRALQEETVGRSPFPAPCALLGIPVQFSPSSRYYPQGLTLDSQMAVCHRAPRPSRPDKARRLGYKAKQGYVVYRIRVRRGGRKRPVPKGAVYGKPVNQGVAELKFARALRSVAEERVGRRCPNLRVLNSYWVNQVKQIKRTRKGPTVNQIRPW